METTNTNQLKQRHGAPILLPERRGNIVGGLKVQRVFSSEAQHPYDQVSWSRRDVVTKNHATGKVIYERLGVEGPSHWEENAFRVTVEKYLFGSRPGSPEYEDSLKHAFDRIANSYTVWGWEEGYFLDLDSALIFNEEVKYLLVNQYWAPNSPVWFNVGQWEQWRWGRPDLRPLFTDRGNPAFFAKVEDGELKVHQAESNYSNPQASACFLTEVGDSMEEILEHLKTEGRIFSSGSGIGINISSMRSSYEPIKGRGRSSGPISFNRGWDRMAAAIKSGGRTRRAARMVLMFADHPDIFDFVQAKRKQEDIAKIILRDHNVQIELRELAKKKLIEGGTHAEKAAARIVLALPIANEIKYSPHMDDQLYGDTLSDQNANHSVSLKGGFWQAFKTNGEYATKWVTNPHNEVRRYRPQELLDLMADAVWENGEPGVHNNDWINLWNPVKEDGELSTSNPCSEYIHRNNTSCNLSSFNLYRFFDKTNRQFDAERFMQAVRYAMIMADLNIERGGFPTPEIAQGTYRYRTTGIGFANLGGLLMAMGLPYDSDDGRWIAAQLTSLLTASCWKASAEMGRELGAYHAFEGTKNSLKKVLNLHRVSHKLAVNLADDLQIAKDSIPAIFDAERNNLPEAQGLTGEDALRAITCNFSSGITPRTKEFAGKATELASKLWDEIHNEERFRNSFVSCIAPTGTISAPMGIYDEGTTSAEPDYTLVKYKQLSGGGSLKMFNTLALEGLRNLGYTEEYVREAALEVGGIDGLKTAAPTQNLLLQHLAWRPNADETGPVRQAINHILGGKTKELEKFLHELEAKKWDNDISDDHKLVLNGTSHMENLPWLDAKDLSVFDCSATNGDGSRSIRHQGHILMLGAMQPFISGATSKTVNLPGSATREDIKQSFILAHEAGVKCIAVFRAESKANAVFQVDTPETRKLKAPHIWLKLVEETNEATKEIIAEASKPRQRKLPGRRSSQTLKFEIAGQLKGFLTIGTYPDGTCGEVFGRLGQTGSFANGLFEAKCKEMSKALQFGVPLEEIIDDNRGVAFEPAGLCKVGDDTPGGRCEEIKTCASVVDMLAKTLEWLFPAENGYRMRELSQTPTGVVKAPAQEVPEPVVVAAHTNGQSNGSELVINTSPAKPARRTGLNAASLCPKCFNNTMVPDGKCKVCTFCGTKDGGCGE